MLGDVRLVGQDCTQRPAERGGELREGDTIVTGANGLVQLRLGDGGMLSIRADTEVKLDRFAFTGKDDRNASLLVSLLKGGFRSVTGLIGQLNRDGYKINTPFATLGIRGTTHQPFVQLPAPPGEQTAMPPGTYDYVTQGTVVMEVKGRTQLIQTNQAGHASPAGMLQILPALPPIYRGEAPRPQPGPPAQPGEPKPQAISPGPLRQTDPAARDSLRTAPLDTVRPEASPTLTSPVQQPSTTLQGPATVSPTPSTQPIQTAPTAPILQQGPATAPMTKPMAPTGPMAPPR